MYFVVNCIGFKELGNSNYILDLHFSEEIRMLKVIWNVIKKIFGIFMMIISPLKRLLCRRKRRTSDTILPMSNHYSIPQDFNQMPANTEVSCFSYFVY